jgi:hypothetical protein
MVQHLSFILKTMGLTLLVGWCLGFLAGSFVREQYHAHQIFSTKQVVTACYGMAALFTSLLVSTTQILLQKQSLRNALVLAIVGTVMVGMALAKMLNAI